MAKFGKIGRGCFKIVIDTSGIDLDLNKQKHRKPNKDLKDEEYKDSMATSSSFKLAFAMDLQDKKTSLIFKSSLQILMTARLTRTSLKTLEEKVFLKQEQMADKEFCSYYNYNGSFKVIPVIWLKENMSMSKLLSMISTPLRCFLENNMKELSFFKKLVKILVSYLKREMSLKLRDQK